MLFYLKNNVNDLVLICLITLDSYSIVERVSCQIWNGDNTEAVEAPFKISQFGQYLLTQYNKKPTAIKEGHKTIKSFDLYKKGYTYTTQDGKWMTVATLSNNLYSISAISLDSGDILIIGFQDDKTFAEINKLHDGQLTRIGTFDEVFVTRIEVVKNS